MISKIVSFQNVGGKRMPCEGQLWYRGYNIKDLIGGLGPQEFGFEKIAYLLVFGQMPTPEELAAVPHHLIGFLPMDRAFSVADYAELARKEINDILSRGKVPVLCGGTGLYIKAIVDNVQYSEAITGDEALRERLRQLARAMYFSNETVEAFLAEATAAQARAVASLLEREAEVRERNKRERLYRRARFPQPKSFADYDFSRVSMPEGYAPEDLMSLAFLDAAEGFVLHGPTGRGKTHMAIAMGTAAVQAGRAARFFTAADMVLWLKRMRREDRLEAAMRELAKCELLIVDEFGYVPLDVEGARLLFQVVADCYERRSLVITTNIEFSKWGTVLADDKLASAMIDRIVHHGRLIEFTGPSRRMDAALMLAGAREAV